MERVFRKLAVLSLLAVAASGCAAGNMSVGAVGPMPPAISAVSQTVIAARTMPAGDNSADTPIGFIGFCIRFPDQCTASTPGASTISLDDATWKSVATINRSVNQSIWPETDEKHYGRQEYWTIPTDGYGDCEDIALTKRKQLIQAGLPMQALRMAVVVTPRDDRHAVLTVSTDKGDIVLDNLTDEIKSWDSSGYRWLERQDAVTPTHWVAIEKAPRLLASLSATPTGQTAHN